MTLLNVTTPQEISSYDLFFLSDKPAVMNALSTVLTRDTAGIVTSYVLGKERWFGPDPIDSTKKCCETHLPPVLRPAGISLKRLGELVRAPKEGFPSELQS